MAATVWKYTLPKVHNTIDMPDGAEVLHVTLQNDMPTIWVRVDPAAPLAPRTFCILGTGFDLPADAGDYIGILFADPFVYHVFEQTGVHAYYVDV